LRVEVAGHPNQFLNVKTGVYKCDKVQDGVLLEHHYEGWWAIDFSDLERIYLAAKEERKK